MFYILALAFVFAIPFAALTTGGWRAIIFLAIPVGLLQEPVRKLASNQPAEYQLIVVAVFAMGLLAAIGRFGLPTLRPLAGSNRNTRALLLLFISLVLVQALHALVRFSTPMVPIIGLLSYLLPIPALWVSYQFARSFNDISRLVKMYVACGFVISLGVLAHYNGMSNELFHQVGNTEMVVYHWEVGVVELYCGFLRSPEVAAWHAAAVGCLAVVLAVSLRKPLYMAAGPAIYLASFYIVVLTGRRKALAIMVIFVVMYLLGLLLARRKSSKLTAVVAITVGALVLGGTVAMAPESKGSGVHWERSATTFDDAGERFRKLGIDSIGWAYNAGGVFGLGTGAGAQGTQHVTGVRSLGAAEGGLGRITVELGFLGLFLAIACAIAVARHVRRCLAETSRHDSELFKLEAGLMAFVGANVPVFIGAAQIFGDPFVLLILGLLLGFVLAAPKIIARKQAVALSKKAMQMSQRMPDYDFGQRGRVIPSIGR